jgi:Glycosyl transferase family 2
MRIAASRDRKQSERPEPAVIIRRRVMAETEITLAVVTRDRTDQLARYLLPSLGPTIAAGHAVFVIDQSSDDSTERLVRDVAGIHYLRSEPGISRARNAAIRSTESPLLAFTDDDVTLFDGWLDTIARLLEAKPEAGAVCGRGVRADGSLLPGVHAGTYRWPKNPFGLGHGFNMAFRRAVFDDVGLFDEELGGGAPYASGEDTDMLYRAMRAGWAVVCSDEITVVHHEWRSSSDERRLHVGYGLGAGAQVARHVAAGDRVMLRLALLEVGRHLLTAARAVVTLQPHLLRLQVAFLGGLARGFVRSRRAQPRVIRS